MGLEHEFANPSNRCLRASLSVLKSRVARLQAETAAINYEQAGRVSFAFLAARLRVHYPYLA